MATKGKGIYVEAGNMDIFTGAIIKEFTLDEPKGNEVLVKMLAAPINPSDIGCIKGRYAGVTFPLYVGFEGVGEIVKTGPEVKSMKVGDWAMPRVPNFGSWRTHCVVPENHMVKADKSMGLKTAATFFVNPYTAYLLLKDVIELKAGEVVIQNGANSAVGQALIQFAKDMGIKTINVVRKREAKAQAALKKQLEDLGADVVVTDEELTKRGADDAWPAGLSKPKLAIDCVAGGPGSELFRHIQEGGTLVNYGMLSGQPLTVSPGDLIFKNKTCTGFWLTTSYRSKPERGQEIAPYIMNLLKQGKYKAPECEMFKIDDFKQALKRATAGYTNVKQLLVMDESYME